MVVWLIGLSGAGKTTLGTALWERLRRDRSNCVLLDGDMFRAVMGEDLGHSLAADHLSLRVTCSGIGPAGSK